MLNGFYFEQFSESAMDVIKEQQGVSIFRLATNF